MSGIKSMYIDSSACVTKRGVKVSSLGVYHVSLAVECIYMDGMMKEVKMSFLEDEGEWRLPGFLYADDLVLCGRSKED